MSYKFNVRIKATIIKDIEVKFNTKDIPKGEDAEGYAYTLAHEQFSAEWDGTEESYDEETIGITEN